MKMKSTKRNLAVRSGVGAALIAGAFTVVAPSAQASASSITMLVSDYMFDSTPLTVEYGKLITKEWDSKYPNTKLNVIEVPGTDVDEATALALRFKEKSTTPDVVGIETPYLSQYAEAGYLSTLNGFLTASKAPAFWTQMPKPVQALTTFDAHVYGVTAGVNDQGLLYDKDVFKKAGLPVPWAPKNWADILSAAKQIKAKVPGVTAMWLGAGTEAGPFNFAQGIANLIVGSPTPTLYDGSAKKWVTSSPGIKAAFAFYSEIFAGGMGAPISQLFTSQAIGSPTYAMKDGKLGIMIGANWMPEIWAVAGTRYWPTAAQHVSAAAMPTEFGQAPGTVSEMSGWAYAVSKAAPNETLAWDLVKMNMEAQNQLDVAEWSGFVPPDPAVADSKANLAFGGGFNGAFNTFVDHAVSLPNNPNLTVYAQGMNTATGDIAQYPKSTSVKAAVSALDQVVTQQLGPNSTK